MVVAEAATRHGHGHRSGHIGELRTGRSSHTCRVESGQLALFDRQVLHDIIIIAITPIIKACAHNLSLLHFTFDDLVLGCIREPETWHVCSV